MEAKMSKKIRSYSKEFKLDALRLLETSDKSVSQLERDLGITPGLLHKWKGRYQLSTDENSNEINLEKSELEQAKARVRQLERELAITQEEREILKKTNAIFSDREKGDTR
jgi:transposase